jgi:uncharacterized protein involved in exopolysaccharide biosynthesis
MWPQVVEVVGPQWSVAVLFAAWALTTFAYYRRQHERTLALQKEQTERLVAELKASHDARVADLRSQIAALKRERGELRRELKRRDEEGRP